MSKIIIVNEKDEIIGYKERNQLEKEDIYRVSALWVMNSNGEVLLAQRAFTKTHHPGRWGPAVAGTVEEGESYEENIIKEIKEEIGLTGVNLIKSIKQKVEGEFNHFTQWFILEIDLPIENFKIDKLEVAEIKWIGFKELKKDVQINSNDYINVIKRIVNDKNFFNQ